MIYMDNAATTLQKPEEVKQAILYALEHMGNAGRGGTEAALDASRSIYAVREKLADFFMQKVRQELHLLQILQRVLILH